MTTDSNKAAINDARALLDALLANDWCDVHVSTGGTEIFIARERGRVNPMPATAASCARDSGEGETISAVSAPHVATLVSVVPVGSVVAQGEIVARIAVLDEEEGLPAPVSGRVAMVHVEVGVLLEFKMPILDIGASAA